ncbi:SMA2 [Candida pseudojiufengensis]|uniref:SMA2 n=1 Tax=Candida pseudojiufengensis TaxID=497109 RepID=UPI002225689B|nr:SMA2 [Candida pseudojiufengensis]KAI5965684.1 SMA2 [Candida pseudojiufengensis]
MIKEVEYESEKTTKTKSSNRIFWLLLEILTHGCLFIICDLFIMSCTSINSNGPYTMELKIEANSQDSKNCVDLIQQSLKFATYLSNDLNIYVNDTTNDSVLQKLDTFFYENRYFFNPLGYCRFDQYGSKIGCFNGAGLNIIVCLLQDIEMLLSELTSSQFQLVKIYYNFVNQICGFQMSKSFPCIFKTYNNFGVAVQWLSLIGTILPLVAGLICLIDLIFTIMIKSKLHKIYKNFTRIQAI